MSEPNKPATVPSVDDIVLLPCPFCGGDAYILESSYKPNSNTVYQYKAYCGQCNAECGGWGGAKSEAAADWNCRAGRKYSSVQEMLDDISPEFAEDFRKHMAKPSVRIRQWFAVNWTVCKSKAWSLFIRK